MTVGKCFIEPNCRVLFAALESTIIRPGFHHAVLCVMPHMVLPLPNDELDVILEEKINNDKVEEEMDEDHANMIRSDIATLIIGAMNDNIVSSPLPSQRGGKRLPGQYMPHPPANGLWVGSSTDTDGGGRMLLT